MDVKPYKIPFPFKKLNKDLIDKIVNDIKQGSTRNLASLANGITPRIFDIWRKQGECDIEHQVDSLCAYLVLSLSSVKQEEVKWARQIIKETDKGHKGAEWTLEHAYWREFGPTAPLKEMEERLDQMEREFENGKKMDSSNAHEEGSAS